MNDNPNLDALLRSALTAEAEHAMTLTDTAAEHQRLRTRLTRDTRRRRLTYGALTAAAAAVAVVAAVSLSGGDGTSIEPLPPASPAPAPPQAPAETSLGTSTTLPAAAVVVRGTAAAVAVRHNLAFAAGSLWSIGRPGTSLLRIDPASGRTVATVPLKVPAGLAGEAVTAAGDYLVVTAAPPGHVVEGEPATNAAYLVVDARRGVVTRTLPVRLDFAFDGNRVASGAGGTWVHSDLRELGLLDPATGAITRRIALPNPATGFAVGTTTLWVASYEDGVALRVDIPSGQLSSVPTGSGTINAIAVGDAGYVWRNGTVMRLEGESPTERARLALEFATGGKADFAVVGDRLACVCGVGGQVTLADTGLTRGSAYDVQGVDTETSIATGGGRIWLLLADGTLLGVDPTDL